MNNPGTLTVVIPAFKARHLAATLRSLAAQEDRDFDTLVVDDASPEGLRALAEPFAGALRLRYVRHGQNLGATVVPAAWNRAVQAATTEWVWVLCDDDLAAPECVGAWRGASRDPENLLRFASDTLEEDAAPRANPPHPERESGAELLRAMLPPHGRFFCLSDHLFRRAAWEKMGGFAPLPKGFFSDYLAWVRLAEGAGVRTLPHGRVGWRLHPESLSGQARRWRSGKAEAVLGFIRAVRSMRANGAFPWGGAAALLRETLRELGELPRREAGGLLVGAAIAGGMSGAGPLLRAVISSGRAARRKEKGRTG